MFYTRYAQACKMRGLSPSYVAQKAGLSKTSVTRWKNGAQPKSDIAAKLAKYLCVSTDYLLQGDEDGPTPDYTEQPPEGAHGVMIPVIGEIAAGCPVVARQNIEGYAVSDIGDPENYFFLRVRGDSMVNAGIKNGSLVLIRRQPTAENNQIVACLVGDESATLKRFFRTGHTVTLMPENPMYTPIVVPMEDFESGSARILGVGVRVVCHI